MKTLFMLLELTTGLILLWLWLVFTKFPLFSWTTFVFVVVIIINNIAVAVGVQLD